MYNFIQLRKNIQVHSTHMVVVPPSICNINTTTKEFFRQPHESFSSPLCMCYYFFSSSCSKFNYELSWIGGCYLHWRNVVQFLHQKGLLHNGYEMVLSLGCWDHWSYAKRTFRECKSVCQGTWFEGSRLPFRIILFIPGVVSTPVQNFVKKN